MVKWIKGKFDCIRKNDIYNNAVKYIFPVIIVLFSFCKVNKGLDITDSAYSLSNFRNLSDLDGMWFFSTFYANLLGGLLYRLPMGHTMLGMSIYTCTVKCGMGILAYAFFVKEIKLSRFYSMLSVVSAIGLCWCPTTILYNYLTYLLFTLGAIVLYKGLVNRSNFQLAVAGFILGSNIFVRLPNLVEAGLIVVVWVYTAMAKEQFKDGFFKTLFCMLGYVISFIPALLGILVTRGIGEYVRGITELMGMTSEAPDYSTKGMLLQLIRSYKAALGNVALFAVLMAVTIVFYYLLSKKNLKYFAEVYACFMALGTLLVFYKRGIFTRNYYDYSAIYGIGKVAVIVIFVFLFAKLFDKSISNDKKLIIMIAIMTGLITPIGSNNDVFSVYNNLFLMLPVTAMILSDFKPRFEAFEASYIFLIVFILGFCFQSCLFGYRFVFRDGQVAPFTSKVYNNQVVKNMLTTEDNAKRLTEVSEIWKEYSLSGEEVLLYGNVSGMGFYLDADIAISTAWPSLASFSTDKFREDMEILREEDRCPVVLISNAEYDNVCGSCSNEKQEILKKFFLNYNYHVIYDNDVFKVMLAQ